MATPAISVRDLVVTRGGAEILHGLSFDIARGSIVGLVGPSGCGKSTLMRAIVGVQRVSTGTVTALDRGAGTPELRHRVGYLTQAPSVYEDLTVAENLGYFATILGAPRTDVARVLAAVDLTDYSRRIVATLSGGQRARVSLATALLGEPELLILDEPTVGLDPVLRRDLWALFRSLADTGCTLLVSSHVMDEATRCDRLLMLRDGDLLADDTVTGLLQRTGTDTVEDAFLTLIDGDAS